MSLATGGGSGGGSIAEEDRADAAPRPPATSLPGRTTVAERALRAVVLQAAATAIGVPRGRVAVHLGSAAGGLAVRVDTPLPIPDLGAVESASTGVPVIERVRRIQHDLQTRVADLTGRAVTRVDVTVTGAVIPPRRRVR